LLKKIELEDSIEKYGRTNGKRSGI